MLRLAHRILSQGSRPIGIIADERFDALSKGAQAILRARECAIIIGDNVSQFYADHEQQEWDIKEDFPCIAPPFDAFFIEWKFPQFINLKDGPYEAASPGTVCGVSALAFPEAAHREIIEYQDSTLSPNEITKHLVRLHREIGDQVKWVLRMDYWVWSPQMNRPGFTEDTALVFIDDRGAPMESAFIAGRWRHLEAARQIEGFKLNPFPEFHVPLLTLSFLNCKNVARVDVTESEGPSQKWLRRMKQPELRYHILDIDPMKQVLRTEGGVEQNGLKKALHICRGHFATYTDEKPLFGRVTGTFWKPAHVRGSIEQGAIVKDYNVKSPVVRTEP